MDKELKVMAAIQRALYTVGLAERERVLAWVAAKNEEGAWREPPIDKSRIDEGVRGKPVHPGDDVPAN